MPIPKNKIIGILVNTLEGRRNQNIPTPNVNMVGKISVKRVAFLPIPSRKLNQKSPVVRSPNNPIAGNLNLSSKSWIPINPKERRMEVNTNLRLLLIVRARAYLLS